MDSVLRDVMIPGGRALIEKQRFRRNPSRYDKMMRVSGSTPWLWSISRAQIRRLNIDACKYEAALRPHEDVRSCGAKNVIAPSKIDAIRNRFPKWASDPTAPTKEIDPPSETLVEYANVSATHEHISPGALSDEESEKCADYVARMMRHGSP